MTKDKQEQSILSKLTQWAEGQTAIQAMLLTISRTNPNAELDEFSDYDIILAVKDIQPFLKDERWLEDFGTVLTVYRDPVQLEYGFERFIRVTQYEDGTKIDYSIWPVGLLTRIAQEPELPDYLDAGYKVLVDKDNLTKGIKPPSYKAYIPSVPTEREYQITVEHFLSNTSYVAKHIRRDDLIPLKYCQGIMKLEYLLTMLEWLMEIENGWTVKPGAYGKGLKKRIRPELWAELENTYVGADKEENKEN